MTVAVGLQHQHCDNFDEIQQEKAKQNGAAIYIYMYIYIYTHEGWNFNSGNYLFTTDTK